jgi:hypothetical protein
VRTTIDHIVILVRQRSLSRRNQRRAFGGHDDWQKNIVFLRSLRVATFDVFDDACVRANVVIASRGEGVTRRD